MFFLSDDPLFSDEELFLLCAASGGKTVEEFATGNPVVFETDLARPLKSLVINLSPYQHGSGDPSPTNVRDIVPWTGLTVCGAGKNILKFSEDRVLYKNNPNNYTYQFTQNGIEITVTTQGGNFILFKLFDITQSLVGKTFCFAFTGMSNNDALVTSDSEGENRSVKTTEYTITNSDVGKVISARIYVSRVGTYSIADGIVTIDDSDMTYVAPVITSHPLTLPTLYGGSFDLINGTGESRRYEDVTFKWSDGRSATVIGNVERRGFIVPYQAKTEADLNNDTSARLCNVAPWKYNYSSDDVHFYGGGYSFYLFLPVGTDENFEFQLVVERAGATDPLTITPEQISALRGSNTLWSDGNGAIDVTYLKKG